MSSERFSCAPMQPSFRTDEKTLARREALLRVKRSWHIHGAFPAASGDCLVGALVAQKRALQIGQTFALPLGQIGCG